MSDCEKPPCKTSGHCCDKKKKQIEDCCPKEKACPSDPGKGKLSSHAKIRNYFLELGKKKKKDKQCFEKRRCLLRKYSDTKGANNQCCPGLTGHHLIAGATFSGTGYCYNHNEALTVCSSGTSWHKGRHGLMHIVTCRGFLDWKKNNPRRTKMSIKELSNTSVDAMKDVFKSADCDWACLKKELESNYSSDKHASDGEDCKKITASTKFEPHCGISKKRLEELSKLADKASAILSSLAG